MRPQRLLILLLALPAASAAGCAASRQTVCSPPPCPAWQGIAFVADGAGNFQAASTSLQHVVAEAQLPLAVRPFVWSHGCPRILADHVAYGRARAEGQRLASAVLALRPACPQAQVFLVGHSAGCGVVLAAAECLPADAVDGIVLLAPSLSEDYDVRPALRSARQGLDVFCSEHDWIYLGLFTRLIGTSDRHWSAASGRYGFRPHADGPADGPLLARLRQHPWQQGYAVAGNLGGHYGAYQPEFLRRFVVPLLQRETCLAAAR